MMATRCFPQNLALPAGVLPSPPNRASNARDSPTGGRFVDVAQKA